MGRFLIQFRLFLTTTFFGIGTIVSVAQEHFENIASQVGIVHSYGIGLPSGGVSTVDFNDDGLDDISLTTSTGMSLEFYVNNGSSFSKLDLNLPLTEGEAKQLLWVDYDNDGDKDLYVTFLDIENRLFRNDGDLTFTDVTGSSGLLRDILPTYGAAWSDYDKDGNLDLYFTDRRTGIYNHKMSNHLYRNLGDGTFEETTLFANVADSSKAPFCAYFLDYDNDGWDDIYVAQDKKRVNTLFKNKRNGTFEDVSVETYTDLAMDAMSVTVGDYDNNGFMDIYVTNIPDGNKLLRNDSHGYFTEVANNTGTGFFNVGWGAQFLDVNNNTNLDLYVSGSRFGTPNPSSALYMNNNAGTFESFALEGDTVTSYSNAVGDFNNDGSPDLVVNNPSPYNTFLWSNLNNANSWIKFDLEGTISNRDAIGTRIEMFIEGKKYIQHKQCGSGFLGQNSGIVHFGIGQASKVDSVNIIWPSGHQEMIYDLAKNTRYKFIEGEQSIFKPELNYVGDVVICSGDSITLSAGLWSNKLNYNWSDGSSAHSLVVHEAGQYSLILTDQSGALNFQSEVVNVIVENAEIPMINTSKSHISCFGEANGIINLEIIGTDSYEVFWSNGLQGHEITNLEKGSYQYEIKINSACSIFGTENISEPDSIGVIIEQTDYKEGSLVKLITSGGREPYSYSWSHTAEDKNELLITENGEYHVSVTDSETCSKEYGIVIENDLITSVNLKDDFSFSVYPNPASTELILLVDRTIGEVESVFLVDLLGNKIEKSVTKLDDRRIMLSLDNLSEGIYIVSAVLKNGIKLDERVQIY